MPVDVQILADLIPSFRAALREAEAEYYRLHEPRDCGYCGASVGGLEMYEHTKAHALDLLRAGRRIQQVADTLGISFGRVAAYKRRAGIRSSPQSRPATVLVFPAKAEKPKAVKPPTLAPTVVNPRAVAAHTPRESQILNAIREGRDSWDELLEVTKLGEDTLGDVLARLWSGGKVKPCGARRWRLTERASGVSGNYGESSPRAVSSST